MSPLLSVIMPFYNCEEYLHFAIESVLLQSFSDFEFIIINDASTDSSDKIVTRYKEKDSRITYIKNNKNKWIVHNLNKGIIIAKWKYIARMDGDDISNIKRFENQIDFLMQNKNIWIVWGQAEIINEKGEVTWTMKKPIKNSNIIRNLPLYSPFIHPSIMIRSEILKENLYDKNFLYCEDYELWFRLLSKNIKWENLDQNVLKYRKHSNSSSKNSKIIALKTLEIRRKYQGKIYFSVISQIWMYLHYLLWIVLSAWMKWKIETLIKKIIK